jgi:hypothetical protein
VKQVQLLFEQVEQLPEPDVLFPQPRDFAGHDISSRVTA